MFKIFIVPIILLMVATASAEDNHEKEERALADLANGAKQDGAPAKTPVPSKFDALVEEFGSYYKKGRFDEALIVAKIEVLYAKQNLGQEHSDMAFALQNLGCAYRGLGEYEQAEKAFNRSLEIYKKLSRPDSPETAFAMLELSELLKRNAKHAQGEKLVLSALSTFEKRDSYDFIVAMFTRILGEIYNAQKKYAEAEPVFRRVLKIDEKVFGPIHQETRYSLNGLAISCAGQGRYAEAEPFYIRSLAIIESEFGLEHPDAAATLQNLGDLYSNQRKYDLAEKCYNVSLKIYYRTLGPDNPSVAEDLVSLARLYRKTGRTTEAKKLEKLAASIKKKMKHKKRPATA